jgi:glycolate oxidase FAD binding subunit
MGSTGEVSGAAHVPAGSAARLGVAGLGKDAVTALRLEGVPPSIAHRRTMLETLLKPFGPSATLAADASQRLWRSVRDVLPFAGAGAERPLWRISTTPGNGPGLARAIAAAADARFIYDWAGGLVWAELASSDDAGSAIVRAAVAAAGGHATLIRAPAAVRASVGVFDPLDPVVAALTQRINAQFDPQGVLNPGRMYAGI